ncbi:MAG: glutaminyl-peptide cyclotransferase, partial [Thermoplasmata archaeon]
MATTDNKGSLILSLPGIIIILLLSVMSGCLSSNESPEDGGGSVLSDKVVLKALFLSPENNTTYNITADENNVIQFKGICRIYDADGNDQTQPPPIEGISLRLFENNSLLYESNRSILSYNYTCKSAGNFSFSLNCSVNNSINNMHSGKNTSYIFLNDTITIHFFSTNSSGNNTNPGNNTNNTNNSTTQYPVYYTYQVLSVLPHDPSAFTQGLIYVNNSTFTTPAGGVFYEGTGLYGKSSLRVVAI